ncbi:MAG: cyclomaltodextrinase C-terminal domain-containing protein, partial [Balneolaceae bacterium]|nr:cyclomaltodextrinase C-terminal domain-containing protein [Balneolaceae bacterium]
VFYRLKELINIRKQHSAFSPLAHQDVINIDDELFSVLRTSEKTDEKILVVANVTGKKKSLSCKKIQHLSGQSGPISELITGRTFDSDRELVLKPYQVMWLKPQ